MWKEPRERGVTSNWGLRKKTDSGNPEEIAFKAESRSGRRGLFWRGRWEWGRRGRKSRVYLGSRGLLSLLSHREIGVCRFSHLGLGGVDKGQMWRVDCSLSGPL